MSTSKLVGVLAVAGVAALLPRLGSAEPALIEGHVFNKTTGVPLNLAQVKLLVLAPDPPGGLAVEFSAYTDAHGFYQLEFDTDDPDHRSSVWLEASCARGERRPAVQLSSAFRPRAGIQRRDLYVAASPLRTFSNCIYVLPFDPLPIPLPLPPR